MSHQPPPFSTPVPALVRARVSQFEPSGDSIDSSPTSPDLPRNESKQGISFEESIEIESQSPLESQHEPEDEPGTERPTKRRRVSISPVVDATPEEAAYEPMALDDASAEIDGLKLSEVDEENDEPLSSPRSIALARDTPSPTEPSTRQPTFLAAPRFKTSDPDETKKDRPLLPDAFSPQRRGAKYVSGGLAAEVRDWLVQMKGATEYDRPTGDSVKLIVDQVSHCTQGEMCLVSGDEAQSAHEGEVTPEHNGAGPGQPARVILAGDGRIPGLGRRTVVAQGMMVSMYQPIWDIKLKDMGRFAVACDWAGETQAS